jgi:hypothetical protein
MKNIIILGSCVSRDIFHHFPENINIIAYFARTSIISLVSNSFAIKESDIALDSAFQRRLLFYDFNKSFFKIIESTHFDYLLIDFIDERFDLLKHDDSYITRSPEFVNSNLEAKFKFELVKRKIESTNILWEESCDILINELKKIISPHKIILHKAFWADRYYDNNVICCFSEKRVAEIKENNNNLERYYSFFNDKLKGINILELGKDSFIADSNHRWGLSPFHYEDKYYLESKNQILKFIKSNNFNKNINQKPIKDRLIISCKIFGFINDYSKNRADIIPLDLLSVKTGGLVTVEPDRQCLEVKFSGNQERDNVYIVSFIFPEKEEVSGLHVKLTLRGWSKISYFAYGFLVKNEYRHVKVVHPRQAHKLSLDLSAHDISYKLENGFESASPFMADGVKLFLKGIPLSNGGVIEVSNIAIFNEGEKHDFRIMLASGEKYFSEINLWWNEQKPEPPASELNKILFQYDEKCYPNYQNCASYFVEGHGISLANCADIPTPVLSPLIEAVSQNDTLRYMYHALNHVNSLLMVTESEKNVATLFAARDLLSAWIDANLFNRPQDIKYTWYDHGTAERMMVLIRMWQLGLTYNYDVRFMGRLLYTIKKHGDLLASEAFYVRHQNYRYHNHAIFQDIALLVASAAISCLESASDWKVTAIERIKDQFEHLIIIENDTAILKENSPGYHNGMLRIVELLAGILAVSEETSLYSQFESLLVKMQRFSSVICYPGGRLPAIGDTFRQPNTEEESTHARSAVIKQGFWDFDNAGFVVAKGLHKRVPFQFIFYAPSLTKTHKHADHLSFTIFFDGVEWLIDPSFYSHQYTDPYPAYLRGPSAHNTIVLEGVEYSLEPNLASICSIYDGKTFKITGQHEAYKNALISRSVNGCLDFLDLIFSDCCYTALKDKKCYLLFHLGETVNARMISDGYILESSLSNHRLTLELPKGCKSAVHKGDSNESQNILGWSGTGFCKVESINTILCSIPIGIASSWRLKADD